MSEIGRSSRTTTLPSVSVPLVIEMSGPPEEDQRKPVGEDGRWRPVRSLAAVKLLVAPSLQVVLHAVANAQRERIIGIDALQLPGNPLRLVRAIQAEERDAVGVALNAATGAWAAIPSRISAGIERTSGVAIRPGSTAFQCASISAMTLSRSSSFDLK